MTGLFVTVRKELLSYFCSPVSYLIAVLFYLFHGLMVSDLVLRFVALRIDQDLFVSNCYGLGSTFFMVVLVPGVLTMRCFAEERRSGSIEILMTAPVRDWAIVLGKWLASVIFFALLWLPTVVLLWVLTFDTFFLGADLSFGPVFAGYLGLFLLSSMLLAFGCFASSLTDNLLLAAILSILFSLTLLQLPGFLRIRVGATDNIYVIQLLEKVDVLGNFNLWFARGLIDTSQIWFYVGGTAFFLYLTTLSFSARRVA